MVAISTVFLWGVLPMPENCSVIIDQLIERRQMLNLTQKQLADAAGLAQSGVARLESKKTIPQLDTLMKVATALGCDLQLVPMR